MELLALLRLVGSLIYETCCWSNCLVEWGRWVEVKVPSLLDILWY